MAVKTKYQGIIKKGVVAASAAGPIGAFVGPFDAGAIGGIWGTMLVSIANRSGHKIDGKFASKFIATVGAGAVAYYGGVKAATWLFHAIPGAGSLTAMGISTALNAIFTYKFGAAVSDLFDSSRIDPEDASKMATTVLAVMCTFPSMSEVRDLLDIKRSV